MSVAALRIWPGEAGFRVAFKDSPNLPRRLLAPWAGTRGTLLVDRKDYGGLFDARHKAGQILAGRAEARTERSLGAVACT